MNQLALFTGVDIPLPELEITLHQPTIREISYIGEMDYFSTIQIICFEKNTIMATNPQGTFGLGNTSNFQIFMTLINPPDEKSKKKLQDNIISVLTLWIPGYDVQLLPNGLGIYLNNTTIKRTITINENNFDVLKNALNELSGVNNRTGGQNSNYNPKGKKAALIAAKIMKGRARAAKNKGGSLDGVLGRYVSVLTVGLSSMSLNECLNLTVYQLYDLIERYGLYVGWDLDIRARLAGGKPEDKPDDWMKDIH